MLMFFWLVSAFRIRVNRTLRDVAMAFKNPRTGPKLSREAPFEVVIFVVVGRRTGPRATPHTVLAGDHAIGCL